MTNKLEMQGPSNDGTITISTPVSAVLNKRLRLAVVERDLPSKAAAIRQALELWLESPPCPQCDGPTRSDSQRPGARYCDHCQKPVLFASNTPQVLPGTEYS